MIPEAKPIEELKAASKGEFVTVTLFTIEDRVGVWRQIARDGRQGIKTPVPGGVVAHVGHDKLIELVRWRHLEGVLSQQAALDVIPVNTEGEPEPTAVG